MDSDDEFNQFVMDEVINSSSLDYKNDLICGATHIIVNDLLNHPGQRGSVNGHDVVDHERLFWHALLFKDYFSDNPTFGPKVSRRRLVFFYNFYRIFVCLVLKYG
jgi:hypothetical protein